MQQNKQGAFRKRFTHSQDQNDRNLKKYFRKDVRPYGIGFKMLEQWSKNNADRVMIELLNKKCLFEELIERNSLSDDTIVVISKILTKICLSPFNENKIEIISLALKENFIKNLTKYLMMIPLQNTQDRNSNKYFWEDCDEFFNNIIILSEYILRSLPTRGCEILPKLLKAISYTITHLDLDFSIKIKTEKLESLQIELNLSLNEIEKKKAVAGTSQYVEDEQPPENFRELSIFPTSNDILMEKQPFLRKNIVVGAYNNVEHYLDVQFRLVKEDFVGPLRQGVLDYINKPNQKNSSIRIHKHVEFISSYCDKGVIGVLTQFQFDVKNKKSDWQFLKYSKRFMYGSLVCFTGDDFKTLIFGKVVERRLELLKKGMFVVGFEPGFDNNYILGKKYLMVESNIYFEPYFHVLTALKKLGEFGFPFEDYIIDACPSGDMPEYVYQNRKITVEDYQVNLASDDSWPTAEQLNLDEFQYLALKAALTQEMVIIQGPPGTGKTYLGLKIVKQLLKNFKLSENIILPILVVCYTNHALDQFLEGLLGVTSRILRVGGQSKNEKLELFNLSNKRFTANSRKTGVNKNLFELKNSVHVVMENIKALNEELNQINKYESVIVFKNFKTIDANFKSSWFESASNEQIRDWLLQHGGNPNDQFKEKQKLLQAVEELEDDEVTNEELDQIIQDNYMYKDESFDNYVAATINHDTLLSVTEMLKKHQEISSLIAELNSKEINNSVFNEIWKHKRQLDRLGDDIEYLKFCLGQGRNLKPELPRHVDLQNPYEMKPNERWQLYFYWLDLYKKSLSERSLKLHASCSRKQRQYDEMRNLRDIEVMREALVVGMTTTCAARLQTTLQALGCSIVIAEEAAEILESHIVVSLTGRCRHLILIGDHQQLRPKLSNYYLEKNYNLSISLFERMIYNNVENHVLGVQHRMRPEIAQLIVPSIYPVLENHVSVYDYPPISGVDKSLYFIDHGNPECIVGDTSKTNLHEAIFLLKLARYLIQNEYEPEDITILAAYQGQFFSLIKERAKYDVLLKDVRITVLDNYQGEENKIILLSLVRNNRDNSIGFLKIENRVCVALSRAKEGLYIMGNMDLLCRNSQIWPKIKSSLQDQNSIGTKLALRCQIHQEQVTEIEYLNDFDKVPEGGCSKSCNTLLNCGHVCPRLCHFVDRQHSITKCKQPCSKILCESNHECPKLCFEDCGECQFPVEKTLPCSHEQTVPCSKNLDQVLCNTQVYAKLSCGHEIFNKPCYADSSTYTCPFVCDTRVEPCGHSCIRLCHFNDDPDHMEYRCRKNCERINENCSTGTHKCQLFCFEECLPCEQKIRKIRSCGHRFEVFCYTDVESLTCSKPCKRQLPCGHSCKQKCNETCGNCAVMVKKIVKECGHEVKVKCCIEEPDQRYCKGNCPRLLRCGHLCQNKCSQLCTLKCKELVEHTKKTYCGHNFKIPCYLSNEDVPQDSYSLLKYCKEQCNAILSCSHRCTGTCGECAQGRIHNICKQKCGAPLICGHECKVSCREACLPCDLPCAFKCPHSACKKKCGEPCTSCKERCSRRCVHVQCKKTCGELCDVDPCTVPCSKILKCGHPCVGFCGDKCPPLCRVCDKETLTEIFFGYEEEDDARFVFLEECKHVIESRGMDAWLNKAENEVVAKCCPLCKTSLAYTQRYSNQIKMSIEYVFRIKKKYYGEQKENEKNRFELLTKCIDLQSMFDDFPTLIALFFKFKVFLQSSNQKRLSINMVVLQSYMSKVEIMKYVKHIYEVLKSKRIGSKQVAKDYIQFLLKKLLQQEQRITDQQIADFQRELQRLDRISQLSEIENHFTSEISSMPKLKTLYKEICEYAFAPLIFDDNANENLRKKLIELDKEIKTGVVITATEKRQIHAALKLSKGHWFKCPNGHLYVIGECGGAMEVGRCNECNAQIGGTGHRLLSTNRHTGEMDGASHAAWSETANNMFNYEGL